MQSEEVGLLSTEIHCNMTGLKYFHSQVPFQSEIRHPMCFNITYVISYAAFINDFFLLMYDNTIPHTT